MIQRALSLRIYNIIIIIRVDRSRLHFVYLFQASIVKSIESKSIDANQHYSMSDMWASH